MRQEQLRPAADADHGADPTGKEVEGVPGPGKERSRRVPRPAGAIGFFPSQEARGGYWMLLHSCCIYRSPVTPASPALRMLAPDVWYGMSQVRHARPRGGRTPRSQCSPPRRPIERWLCVGELGAAWRSRSRSRLGHPNAGSRSRREQGSEINLKVLNDCITLLKSSLLYLGDHTMPWKHGNKMIIEISNRDCWRGLQGGL